VHVAGNGGRRDFRGVVVADVKHVIAFMLVSADQFGLQAEPVQGFLAGLRLGYRINKLISKVL